MSTETEAALVQALITNTPEALLRLLTSSSTAEPDAAAAALIEALGKQDALAKALAATTAARRAVAADRAETAAGCFDGRFRSEVSRALVRLSEGESCCIEKIQDEDAREALEHVLRGLGLRPAPRDELAGAQGFAADDACSRRACAALAASMRPVAAPSVAAPAEAAAPADDENLRKAKELSLRLEEEKKKAGEDAAAHRRDAQGWIANILQEAGADEGAHRGRGTLPRCACCRQSARSC